MKVIVADYGVFLGVKDGLIRVRKGEENRTLSADVKRIVLATGGIAVSTSLLRLAAENGIEVVVLDSSGRISGKFSPLSRKGNVAVRREQYKAQSDERGLRLARCFARGKMLNQYYLLKSVARNRERGDVFEACREIKRRADRVLDCRSRDEIIYEEARAAEAYWKALSKFCEFDGRRRKRHEDPDPFNMMLNYGYSVLMTLVFDAIDSTNLDPFAGFLHGDNPRHPALAADLMEEFRQPVVDRAIMKIKPEVKDGRLSIKTRKEILLEIHKRLETQVTFKNRKLPIEYHIHLQARRIERFLLGEETYKPFVVR